MIWMLVGYHIFGNLPTVFLLFLNFYCRFLTFTIFKEGGTGFGFCSMCSMLNTMHGYLFDLASTRMLLMLVVKVYSWARFPMAMLRKKSFSTFFQQLFHIFSTVRNAILTVLLASFPQTIDFPFHFSTERELILGDILWFILDLLIFRYFIFIFF